MASKSSKTPELVFNLQWSTGQNKSGDSKNLIGMFDTTLTTLNFDTFKSYLLKNSGITASDIRVTYIYTDDNKEWVIDSQSSFELALSAFRLKAKLHEVIYLKLEKITNPGVKVSNAPEWFTTYMKTFKSELMAEILQNFNECFDESKLKPKCNKEINQESNIDKHKSAIIKKKKARKCLYAHPENPIDKELLRTLKYDRKLEIKLDKLDAKTKKIKQKKQALLINNLPGAKDDDSDKEYVEYVFDDGPFMDAASVLEMPIKRHMNVTDQYYTHTWKIINKGQLTFDSRTKLRWTWGSVELKPLFTNLNLPPLSPNEEGFVRVSFYIPNTPGKYESYWNFYHGEVRFGSCLSCCLMVDPPAKLDRYAFNGLDFTRNNFYITSDDASTSKRNKYSLDLPLKKSNFNEDDVIDLTNCDDEDETQISNKMNSLALSEAETEKIDHNDDDDDDNKEFNDFEKVSGYGITEEELIVDLSKKEKKVENIMQNQTDQIKAENLEKNLEEIQQLSQDNNNNNNDENSGDGNKSSTSSADSVSSDSNSSYDLVDVRVENNEEGKEDDFIVVALNFGGQKCKLPRSWINPELIKKIENSENSPPLPNIIKEEPVQDSGPSTFKIEPCNENLLPTSDELKSFTSHCSWASEKQISAIAGTCSDLNNHEEFATFEKRDSYANCGVLHPMSNSEMKSSCTFSKSVPTDEMNSSRLFIFPQNNPGYEVVEDVPKTDDNFDTTKVFCPTNKVEVLPSDSQQTYTWAHSQTQYTLADIQNNGTGTHAHLRFDPYGPLENATQRSTAATSNPLPVPRFEPVPNFQQTPKPKVQPSAPISPSAPESTPSQRTTPSSRSSHVQQNGNNSNCSPTNSPGFAFESQHYRPELGMLPEMVSGAVNVASSAINTARSVINMIVPRTEPGKWVNGHWVTDQPESLRAKNLRTLASMGFWDNDLNATLLARYNDDLLTVLDELLTS